MKVLVGRKECTTCSPLSLKTELRQFMGLEEILHISRSLNAGNVVTLHLRSDEEAQEIAVRLEKLNLAVDYI